MKALKEACEVVVSHWKREGNPHSLLCCLHSEPPWREIRDLEQVHPSACTGELRRTLGALRYQKS
jgi:hypothetical protein